MEKTIRRNLEGKVDDSIISNVVETITKDLRLSYKHVNELRKVEDKVEELTAKVEKNNQEKQKLKDDILKITTDKETVEKELTEKTEDIKTLSEKLQNKDEIEQELLGIKKGEIIKKSLDGREFVSDTLKEFILNQLNDLEYNQEDGSIDGLEEYIQGLEEKGDVFQEVKVNIGGTTSNLNNNSGVDTTQMSITEKMQYYKEQQK